MSNWYRRKSTHYLLPPKPHYQDLPSGLYEMGVSPSGMLWVKEQIMRQGEIVDLLGGPGYDLIEDIKRFQGQAEEYQKLGFPHRRGYLLHGPPGTGKTTMMLQVAKHFIAQNSLAIMVSNPRGIISAMEKLREVDNRLVLLLIEDLDNMLNYQEAEFLQLTDGLTDASSQTVLIATTNYLERIPDRVSKRPGRIDRRFKVLGLALPQREYLLDRWGVSQSGIEQLGPATDGYTVAMLKELVIQIMINRIPPGEALQGLSRLLADEDEEDENEKEEVQVKTATKSTRDL